jgi:hypothetical protein
MIVIVASRFDEQAERLAERWAPLGASLLTCRDLSEVGWQYAPDKPAESVAVIGGRAIAARDITGVLTRLPYVSEHETLHIVRQDRAYVAQEMTAFLRVWLNSLECPVLNRPSSACLSGPGWPGEQWIHLAARLGIRVQPVRWRAELSADVPKDDPASADVTVTVVGGDCLGSVDRTLAKQARLLAEVARVDLLSFRFGGDALELRGADPWPDVSSPEVADAILERLEVGGGRC